MREKEKNGRKSQVIGTQINIFKYIIIHKQHT